jgi:hypothetical protein
MVRSAETRKRRHDLTRAAAALLDSRCRIIERRLFDLEQALTFWRPAAADRK